MKVAIAVIVALLVGLSFHAGVLHGRGELVPAIEAKLTALKAWVFDKLPTRVQGWLK